MFDQPSSPSTPESDQDTAAGGPIQRPAEIPPTKQEIETNAIALSTRLALRRTTEGGKTLADNPEVARYYRPELNGGLPASRIPQFLDMNVAWSCDAIPGEQHVWLAKPQNFTRTVLKHHAATGTSATETQPSSTSTSRQSGRYKALRAAGLSPTPGCPGCSGRMATSGNNLKLSYPEVMDHWDFSRNAYGPELYLPRSVHLVHWIDPESGRCSEASIVSRTQRNKIGTNRQDSGLEASETNNLALLHPVVAARLISDANGHPVDPATISPHSNRMMVWRCPDPRHPDFQAVVFAVVRAETDGSRTHGCPACRGFVLAPGCSLADLFPDIAADYERAGTNPTPASEVIPGTNAEADFACETCGYHWRTSVHQRTRMGQGCPACFGSAVTPTNNLAVLFPELVSEWHPENSKSPHDVRPGHDEKVKWICRKNPDHVWEIRPASRTQKRGGTGCPHCDISGVSKWQVEFFSALKEQLPTLEFETEEDRPDSCLLPGTAFVFDAFLPEHRVAFEYDGYFWHCEPKHYDRDRRKNDEAEAQGITVIRIRLGLDAIGPYDVVVGKRPDLNVWIRLLLEQVEKLMKARNT